MLIPERPFNIFAWCAALRDPSLYWWLREIGGAVEVLSHVLDPRVEAMAEFFSIPNGGWTVERQILTAAEECGQAIIINIDNHGGNGRDEDGGSATGKGRYHEGKYTEGGFTQALNKIFGWPQRVRQYVIAVQITNETKPNSANLDWVVKFLAANAHRIRARGWKIIVDPNQASALVTTNLFDIIDPHALWVEYTEAGKIIARLQAEFPGKEIWVTELLDLHAEHQVEIIEAVIEAGAEAYNAWTGNTIHFPGDFWDWNFRRRKPAITLNINSGFTPQGVAYNELHGIGLPGTDPKPLVSPEMVRQYRFMIEKTERQLLRPRRKRGKNIIEHARKAERARAAFEAAENGLLLPR